MRPRIIVLISSIIVALYFLPSGICAWEENLEIGISVTTGAKFAKGANGFRNIGEVPSDVTEVGTPAAISTNQDSLKSAESGTVTDSGIKVPSAASTGDQGNVQSVAGTETPATGADTPAVGSVVSTPTAVSTNRDSLSTESDTVTDSGINVSSDTGNLPESGNESPN